MNIIISWFYKSFSGNYYSLRSNHEKAVQYFQRALRLNPHYLAALTLMGHEYMEMKNTNAAIQCYRQAIGNLFYFYYLYSSCFDFILLLNY